MLTKMKVSENNIFEIQPIECRSPLPKKELENMDWLKKENPKYVSEVVERIIAFDPTELYARIGQYIDPYKRHQSLNMDLVFPKLEILCSCGCGQPAEASDQKKEDGIHPVWQRKWRSHTCQQFASDVLSILNNYFKKPQKYISYYHGKKCIKCGSETAYELELDHIIGVKQGGGGCWLSNYEWKCKTCHVQKTNKDFGRKGNAKPGQIVIFPE